MTEKRVAISYPIFRNGPDFATVLTTTDLTEGEEFVVTDAARTPLWRARVLSIGELEVGELTAEALYNCTDPRMRSWRGVMRELKTSPETVVYLISFTLIGGRAK